jgi:hypothetical protein
MYNAGVVVVNSKVVWHTIGSRYTYRHGSPVSLVDGVDDEHDGPGGAEEEGDDRDDADVAVRAVEGQVEHDESDAAVLEPMLRILETFLTTKLEKKLATKLEKKLATKLEKKIGDKIGEKNCDLDSDDSH